MQTSHLQNLSHNHNSVILRELGSADAAWMAAIHGQCFDEPQRWHADSFRSLISQRTNKAIALIVDYKPVGFMIGSHVADESEILTFAVAPDERRKGYGKCLLETFIEEQERRRLESIFLEVIETNTSAIRLYETHGFKTIAKRPNYYLMPPGHDKKATDGLLMKKNLFIRS